MSSFFNKLFLDVTILVIVLCSVAIIHVEHFFGKIFVDAIDAWPSDACENSYMLSGSRTSPSSTWTVGQINAILKAHNDARRNVDPMASKYQNSFTWGSNNLGMRMLVWDQKLADNAAAYIQTCPGMVHSSSAYRSNVVGDNVTYSSVGENLAAGYGSAAYNKISIGVTGTDSWVAELISNTWTYSCNPFDSAGTCSGAGHYTQVVSSRTWAVGCDFAYCPNDPYKNYLCCQYGEAGNMNIASSPVYNKTDDAAEASACQNVSKYTTTAGPTSLSTSSTPSTTTSSSSTTSATDTSTTTATASSTTMSSTTTSTTVLPTSPPVDPSNRYEKSIEHFRHVIFFDSQSASSSDAWSQILQNEIVNNTNINGQEYLNSTYFVVVQNHQFNGGLQANETLKQALNNLVSVAQSAAPPSGSSNLTNFQIIQVNCFFELSTNGRTKPLVRIFEEVDNALLNYDDAASALVMGFFVDDNWWVAGQNSSTQENNYDSEISNYIRTMKGKKMIRFTREANGCSLDNNSYTFTNCLQTSDFVVAFNGNFSTFVSSIWMKQNTTRDQLFGSASSLSSPDPFLIIVTGVADAVAARTVISSVYSTFGVIVGSITTSTSVVSNSSSSFLPSTAPSPALFCAINRLGSQIDMIKLHRNRRGIYLQILAAGVGQITFSSNATWFQKYDRILLNDTKIDMMLDELRDKRFNAVALYNLFPIMGDPTNSQLLRNFMYRARKFYGVETIDAIADSYLPAWDRIAAFQNQSVAMAIAANSAENRTLLCFDGAITEIEWWAGGVVGDALSVISYSKFTNPPARRFQNFPLTYSTYVGWISASDVNALVGSNLVSTIYTHGYVKDPSLVQGYIAARADNILAATINYPAVVTSPQNMGAISVSPIFSAEGREIAAGAEVFMGDWLYYNSPGAVPTSEDIVTWAINASWPAQVGVFGGFQWYEYFFVSAYTANALNQEKYVEPTSSTTTTSTTSTTSTSMTTSSSSTTTTTSITSSSSVPTTATPTLQSTAGTTPSTTASGLVTLFPTDTTSATSNSNTTIEAKNKQSIISLTVNFPLLNLHKYLIVVQNALRQDAVVALKYLFPVSSILLATNSSVVSGAELLTITFTVLTSIDNSMNYYLSNSNFTSNVTAAIEKFSQGVDLIANSPNPAAAWMNQTSALLLSLSGSTMLGNSTLVGAPTIENNFAAAIDASLPPTTTPAPPNNNNNGAPPPSSPTQTACQQNPAQCIAPPIVIVSLLIIVALIYLVYTNKKRGGKRPPGKFFDAESVSLDEYFAAQQEHQGRLDQMERERPLMVGSQPYYPIQSQQDVFFGQNEVSDYEIASMLQFHRAPQPQHQQNQMKMSNNNNNNSRSPNSLNSATRPSFSSPRVGRNNNNNNNNSNISLQMSSPAIQI